MHPAPFQFVKGAIMVLARSSVSWYLSAITLRAVSSVSVEKETKSVAWRKDHFSYYIRRWNKGGLPALGII